MSEYVPMNDLPLFGQQPYGGVPPHVKDSDTSREAAMSVLPKAGSKRRRIFDLIAGSKGVTDDELEGLTGWRHQTVSARRRELVLLELVKDSGERRKTSSGRSATVWVAA